MPFHYEGVAKEFPTAPKDSFFVANQSYIAAQHRLGCGRQLPRADRRDQPGRRGQAHLRACSGPSAAVTDIVNQRHVVGSNLTAVELSGLTRIELGFALVLAAAATGLALGLGFQERRRTFAIASALGARTRQLGGFVWGESIFVTGGGLILGAVIAAVLSVTLVDVLTGRLRSPTGLPVDPVGLPGRRRRRRRSRPCSPPGSSRSARCAARRSRSCATSRQSRRAPRPAARAAERAGGRDARRGR